ncbi:antitoxin PaaA2 family protein [Duganella aceris]|uniref:Stability determinant domain-containing protein n=1 Tax=Duganella aceris TaxID=2703883 RepID=A0ABX0FEN6_9BURK|nr:hypothetical protein [Duganella aceris]NGZ83004.1 hypothetical protein [Duganella aceris]
MNTQTIEPAALARLADAGGNFNVSVLPEGGGWIVCVHDEAGDRALLDLDRKATAVFDALQAVEQHLRTLGVLRFEVDGGRRSHGDPTYEEWLKAEVQAALDDPSPLVAHDEAVRQIRAAIRAK